MAEQGVRILVVSDDAALHAAMRSAAPVGVEIESTVDARSAWDVMKQWTPSGVVVDLQTGSAGGFGLCRDMGSSELLADVPVLMLLERTQDAWLARQAGAAAHRVKPIHALELVRCALEVAGSGAGPRRG